MDNNNETQNDDIQGLPGGRIGHPDQVEIPDELPVLPVQEVVIFPHQAVPLAIAKERSLRLMEETSARGRLLALVGSKTGTEEPAPDELQQVGTAGLIMQMLKMPDGTIRTLVQGLRRIRLGPYTQVEPYLRARVQPLEEIQDDSPQTQGMARNLVSLFQRVVPLVPYLSEEMLVVASNLEDPGQLCDFIASHINIKSEESQELLETLSVPERLAKLTKILNRELEILEIGSKIQADMKQEMDKAQREAFLRSQIRAIQRELGEEDSQTQEIEELREKIAKADLSEEARKEADLQLERLERIHPASPERAVGRTYIDWLIELPWTKGTDDRLDLKEAHAILEADHYDLEKVKERIIEYLAVRKLKQDMHGPILCFVGPPGVGKTSMGQSIARALGRKFVRLSLGGVRDEAEIRGHRRTYVGALPGRIIQGIRKAGSNNPVFMLDEVDKVGADFRGDPSAALLEVLDPEQNKAFEDHYLALSYDLSKVMFVTTANLMEPIIPALRDRMEIIALPGYTEPQKVQIARRFLIPKQTRENGLGDESVDISDGALARIIGEYTREAGVRNLEREVATVLRKVARKMAEEMTIPPSTDSSQPTVVHIEADAVPGYLGPRRFRGEVTEGEDEVGVATGLAVTEAGGEVLFIEATLIPGGKGNLILTGHLGEVMQESARAALTYATTRCQKYGVAPDFREKYDIHIHVPAGATPKDGPSAGVAMTSALISAITGRALHKHIAMTGEITLRGRVLPIGGVKEKVLAAHRAGCTQVCLPKENDRDLEDLPDFVKEQLKINFVNHLDELLPIVLANRQEESPVKTYTGERESALAAEMDERSQPKTL
jgi:ATP-dependent Lon protease